MVEEDAVEGYKRINDTRTEQLLQPDPEMVITNCPFCLTMIADGVKEIEGASAQVLDVAELVWRAME